MSIPESVVRDHLNLTLRGRVEVAVPFGRVDIVTDTHVFEVEPFATWRHGARQALAYSAQTGLRPAVAVYGDMSPAWVDEMFESCRDMLDVWVLDDDRWAHITAKHQTRWCSPPSQARLEAAVADHVVLRFPARKSRSAA